jgi:hypothetical protein
MRTTICRAIATRTLLAFDYDGHHRTVEPHCHGTGPHGQELVRGYQIAGSSKSGTLGWRLFDVARISELRSVPEHFAPRADYNRVDAAMHPVHCCL